MAGSGNESVRGEMRRRDDVRYAALWLGFFVQFGAVVYGYGQLQERVADLARNQERIERVLEHLQARP